MSQQNGRQNSGDQAMSVDETSSEEAKEILERMNTLQALLNSLAGRMDPLSVSSRKDFDKELAALRIKKTGLKSLSAQILVLDGVISRRQNAIVEAAAKVQEATLNQERLNKELADAQCQLEKLTVLKAQEDASNIAPQVAQALGQTNQANILSHGQGLAELLPPEKAAVFQECLQLLSSMMGNQPSGSQAMPVPQPAQASCSMDSGVLPNIPAFPGGGVRVDPYSASPGTPRGRPRPRAKSVEPSPLRSRSRNPPAAQEDFGDLGHHFSQDSGQGSVPG